MRNAACLFLGFWLLLSGTSAWAQPAPDGADVYAAHCERCHSDTLPRMPTRDALAEREASDIALAITNGVMRQFGALLTAVERRAVAEFLAGDPPGTLTDATPDFPASAYCVDEPPRLDLSRATWNGWGAGLENRRFQTTDAAGLTASDVEHLTLKWAFGFPNVSAAGSQPTIVYGRVLVGTRTGLVYALDADTGCVYWTHEAPGGVRTAISVGPHAEGGFTAYFGDSLASTHAVDVATGELRWSARIEDHPAAVLTGAPTLHDGTLYVPVSSLEEVSAADPRYECCTFRGSVVALDAANGERRWKTYVVEQEPQPTVTNALGAQNYGPSGAAIWSAPTLDPDRGLLYVATGDAYSDPPAPESDAIVALAMDTGEVRWVTQTTEGDAFNLGCSSDNPIARANCPESDGPDVDYGSSPALVTDASGNGLVLAGQKSGVLHAMRPEDGSLVWSTRVSEGGLLGGIEWGFATDGEQVYLSLSDALERPPGAAGGVTAVRVDDGAVVWHAPPVQDTCGGREGCHTAQPAAATVIPGVAFAGSLDGHLRAHDVEDGRIIWDVDTGRSFQTVNGVEAKGGAINGPGPTVVDGMVFVVSGYSTFGMMGGNVLLAFGLE